MERRRKASRLCAAGGYGDDRTSRTAEAGQSRGADRAPPLITPAKRRITASNGVSRSTSRLLARLRLPAVRLRFRRPPKRLDQTGRGLGESSLAVDIRAPGSLEGFAITGPGAAVKDPIHHGGVSRLAAVVQDTAHDFSGGVKQDYMPSWKTTSRAAGPWYEFEIRRCPPAGSRRIELAPLQFTVSTTSTGIGKPFHRFR
jgi:hypothetical protein